MGNFARKFGQFIAGFWPIIAFYAAIGLVVSCGVLNHPEKRQPFMPNGSDTVPNNISCQFRGAEFCHPKEFKV